jgi:hypothetical protein
VNNCRAGIGALCALIATSFAGSVAAAESEAPARFDPAALREQQEAFNKVPDTPGSGKFPALKEEVASFPDHVIYRPRDLAKVPKQSLGVIAWGNGGCSPDGAGARLHLLEIASHGYLAVANGKIMSGPNVPAGQEMQMPAPGAQGSRQANTSAGQLRETIDWAVAESQRKDSPYFGLINTKWIAVSGWSCGGIQALRIGADPRVATVVAHNTGIFNEPPKPPPGMTLSSDMNLGKDALAKLHTPIIYILGGPTDIAYANGMDDYNRIEHVPAMVANIDVGHGGTFMQPNGGAAATVAVKWLDWQLKGDREAARYFTGEDCKLCADASWKLERKGF